MLGMQCWERREGELQLSRGMCELIRCITCTEHWTDGQLPYPPPPPHFLLLTSYRFNLACQSSAHGIIPSRRETGVTKLTPAFLAPLAVAAVR